MLIAFLYVLSVSIFSLGVFKYRFYFGFIGKTEIDADDLCVSIYRYKVSHSYAHFYYYRVEAEYKYSFNEGVYKSNVVCFDEFFCEFFEVGDANRFAEKLMADKKVFCSLSDARCSCLYLPSFFGFINRFGVYLFFPILFVSFALFFQFFL